MLSVVLLDAQAGLIPSPSVWCVTCHRICRLDSNKESVELKTCFCLRELIFSIKDYNNGGSVRKRVEIRLQNEFLF